MHLIYKLNRNQSLANPLKDKLEDLSFNIQKPSIKKYRHVLSSTPHIRSASSAEMSLATCKNGQNFIAFCDE